MIKAEFPASLLQFSVSHDPSVITLMCDETFQIIIREKSCADSYFCGNV